MDFTPDEEKMISWLHRQHSNWRTTRVITLVASVLCACFSARDFFSTGFGAMPLLLLGVATYGLSYTLGSWAGRPEISLLLKLVESARARSQA